MLWATVGDPWLQPLVSLREAAAGPVAVSCGDRCNDLVWHVLSSRADVL